MKRKRNRNYLDRPYPSNIKHLMCNTRYSRFGFIITFFDYVQSTTGDYYLYIGRFDDTTRGITDTVAHGTRNAARAELHNVRCTRLQSAVHGYRTFLSCSRWIGRAVRIGSWCRVASDRTLAVIRDVRRARGIVSR